MRRIIVGIKRVVDHSVHVHLHADGSGVVTDGVKMSVNPFCEIALEEAIRIRERGLADEVLAVSVGTVDCEQQLRTALAMGADRALRIGIAADLEPLTVARCLLALVERESPILVLLGKQAIDSDNNQTGQMLAALWGRPQATFASSIEIDGTRALVAREIDEGIEEIEIDLPAVVTTDLRLNEPRYVKLPQLLKAKQAAIQVLTPDDLGVTARNDFRVAETIPPPSRPAGTRVDSAHALIAALAERSLL